MTPAEAKRACPQCGVTFVPTRGQIHCGRYCANVTPRNGRAKWAPDKLAELERMVGDGMTFAAIALALGITKNQAIGQATRRGFKRRPEAKLTTHQIARQRAESARQARPPAPMLAFPENGCCRFPYGDPGAPGFRFCGEPARPASSYCAEHHAVCCKRDAPPEAADERPYDPEADAIGSYCDGISTIGKRVKAGAPVPEFLQSANKRDG